MIAMTYEQYGVWVKKDAETPKGARNAPVAKQSGRDGGALTELLSEISKLRADIIRLKEDMRHLHETNAALSMESPKCAAPIRNSAIEAALPALDRMLSEPMAESPLEEPRASPAVDVDVGEILARPEPVEPGASLAVDADVSEILANSEPVESGVSFAVDAGVDVGGILARPEPIEPEASLAVGAGAGGTDGRLRGMVRVLLPYLDELMMSLPESRIREFAWSPFFDTYKEIFAELELS
jgi:hypothetical protein